MKERYWVARVDLLRDLLVEAVTKRGEVERELACQIRKTGQLQVEMEVLGARLVGVVREGERARVEAGILRGGLRRVLGCVAEVSDAELLGRVRAVCGKVSSDNGQQGRVDG